MLLLEILKFHSCGDSKSLTMRHTDQLNPIFVADFLWPGATNQQKVTREEDEAEKEIAVPTSVR